MTFKTKSGIEDQIDHVNVLLIINSKTNKKIPIKNKRKFITFILSSLCLSHTNENIIPRKQKATTIGIPLFILQEKFLSP